MALEQYARKSIVQRESMADFLARIAALPVEEIDFDELLRDLRPPYHGIDL